MRAAHVAILALLLSVPLGPIEARASSIRDVDPRPFESALGDSGLPHFFEIEPGLARGGQPTEQGLRLLRERGYRTVVSFRRNSNERRALEEMGIRYVEIPIRAGLVGSTAPTMEEVARFLSIVSDSSQRPVFIHCRRGKDRTGAMAAIYRIQACGWTKDKAIREMLTLGFNRYYGNLMQFVRTYAP
ncbi:MAG TPA: tyrosine-protein phosphatase [Candidatus Eisenbacteria bacterium]|nr:tyrosine-protein phosphatase [Candidatus Eisenbacteria bacterium]